MGWVELWVELVKFRLGSIFYWFDDRVCGGGCRIWLFCVLVCIGLYWFVFFFAAV